VRKVKAGCFESIITAHRKEKGGSHKAEFTFFLRRKSIRIGGKT
jgi:hypothetical protein